MGKEHTLPLLAITILIISSSTTLYVYAQTTNQETITIANETYTKNQIFDLGTQKTLEIEDKTYTGIHLSNLIKKIGISNPEQYQYILTGSDGYQKTVTWENLQNGILTTEQETIFSDLPKAFRVKNIKSIEVK